MIELLSESNPKARKDDNCMACDWIINTDLQDIPLTFADLRLIVKAGRSGWKIRKGDMYLKQPVKFEGEIRTFRAIPEIHDICIKYDLYQV